MKQVRSQPSFVKNPVVWLAASGALLYSSWPLGYILNPTVSRTAFASQLEATNQPYNWLFISLDVLSGLALLLAGALQLPKTKAKAIRFSVISYMVFGATVIAAALIPFNCNTLASSCYDVAHSPLAITHGLASTLSVIAILASLILIIRHSMAAKARRWLNTACLLVLAGWLLIGSLALLDNHRPDENLVQYAAISISSLTLLVAIAVIERSQLPSAENIRHKLHG